MSGHRTLTNCLSGCSLPTSALGRSGIIRKSGVTVPLQAKDASKVLNWRVIDQSSKLIGTVQEVVEPQDACNGSCPLLRIQAPPSPTPCPRASPTGSPTASHDSDPVDQHLIPWVPAIVQSIHPPSRTVVITPPPGLLELGRQQRLLQQLKPELILFGKPVPGSMAERLGQHFMPTKRQLAAAGREDLVKLVTAAGGFIYVAHLLGLRAKRKPEGYWDASENLDRELSLFVAGMWTCLDSCCSEEPYFYNQVTGRTQWEAPHSPQSIPVDDAGTFIFVEEDADRVMPSRSAVLSAGRFDLHHGIMYQGGYRAAALELDRPHSWPRHKKFATAQQLAKELRRFNCEEGLPRDLVPSASMLRATDRHDLLSEIQRHGGALSLAPQIGMRTQRGSGYTSTAAAVKALLDFAGSCNAGSNVARDSWHMPTQRQLRQAQRFDLLTAIAKFGQADLAQAAGLKPNLRGKPGRASAPSGKAQNVDAKSEG
ncbi:hypothetical protein ABBQ32_005553 [Trebouxia sp. C0010 RCD-2024]